MKTGLHRNEKVSFSQVAVEKGREGHTRRARPAGRRAALAQLDDRRGHGHAGTARTRPHGAVAPGAELSTCRHSLITPLQLMNFIPCELHFD